MIAPPTKDSELSSVDLVGIPPRQFIAGSSREIGLVLLDEARCKYVSENVLYREYMKVKLVPQLVPQCYVMLPFLCCLLSPFQMPHPCPKPQKQRLEVALRLWLAVLKLPDLLNS